MKPVNSMFFHCKRFKLLFLRDKGVQTDQNCFEKFPIYGQDKKC